MRLTRVAVGLLFFLAVLSAQKPPAGGSGTPAPTPGKLPPTITGNGGQPTTESLNRELYLTGKVLLDDGTPPPQSLVIERVCTGNARALAYTDKNGGFAFQLGHTGMVMQDASESQTGMTGMQRPSALSNPTGQPRTAYNVPDAQLATCDLRAVLPGYRSDTIPLAGRRLLDDPNVGTIVLHRLAGVTGTVVSVTTLQAPKNALSAYEKGLRLVKSAHAEDAFKYFQKAVSIDPKFAAAWYELGKLQEQNRDYYMARQSYGKSLESDPKFMGPYEQLSDLAVNAGDWKELASITERLLALDPVSHPQAYLFNAVANLKLSRFDLAEKSARAGEKADTEHRYPKREEVLAMLLAHRHEYTGAAEHMRIYLQYAPTADDAARMRTQLAYYERMAEAQPQAKAAEEAPADKGNPQEP